MEHANMIQNQLKNMLDIFFFSFFLFLFFRGKEIEVLNEPDNLQICVLY